MDVRRVNLRFFSIAINNGIISLATGCGKRLRRIYPGRRQEAAERGPEEIPSSDRSLVGRILLRIADLSQRHRTLVVALIIGLFLAIVALSIILPLVFDLSRAQLESLGYLGVFLANLIGTASIFVPLPLTTVGQALIVALGTRLNPFLVALAGASGMTLGEVTAYGVGLMGRLAGGRRRWPLPGRMGRLLRKVARLIDRLMARYGFWTLLVLSAIPNPVFELAGISAGATRMNFWIFLLAVGIGKLFRSLILAYVGNIF